jgi:glycosyltransferase involved in cell wall biosynthesis
LHEILKRMAANGHRITMFATSFPGGSERDSYDGIDIIRKGNWYDANYVLPFQIRSFVRSNPVDLVIEDVNKIPFFLPKLVDKPVVPVVPHLFGATVFRETNFLFASYVWLWERLIPSVYRDCRFAVISPSTKDDLVARGIAPERVDVVLCGLDHGTYRLIDGVTRYEEPTIVHFGRIRKYKSVDVVIRAFGRIKVRMPNARLIIVGDGPYRPALQELVGRLGLEDSVRFTGVVKVEDLIDILNRSHVFLNASPKEGWGLTVVEANACGVPVVASRRPGLQDSVLDGRTGYLVEYGDDRAFAERAIELLQDDAKWQSMSEEALTWARSLTWERCAREMEALFMEEVASSQEAAS